MFREEGKHSNECGERLICREKNKTHNVFNVNFQNDDIYWKEICLEKSSGIPQEILKENERKSLIFASCQSAQGCTVDDDITIFVSSHFW